MMVVDPVNTKEIEDRIQELQGQVDILIKEKVVFEMKLQEQVALQCEVESLGWHKTHMLGLLKEDDARKVQNLDQRSQVDGLKQQRANL